MATDEYIGLEITTQNFVSTDFELQKNNFSFFQFISHSDVVLGNISSAKTITSETMVTKTPHY